MFYIPKIIFFYLSLFHRLKISDLQYLSSVSSLLLSEKSPKGFGKFFEKGSPNKEKVSFGYLLVQRWIPPPPPLEKVIIFIYGVGFDDI